MAFRDENEALRAKVRALEEEVETLQERLAERDAPAGDEPSSGSAPLAAEPSADEGSIGAMVAAREAAEREARRERQSAQERRRQRRIRRYAKRPPRVRVARQGGRLRVEIAPKLLRDKLLEQAPWGYGFAFINPGVFVVMIIVAVLAASADVDVPSAIGLGVPIWAVLLLLINVGWALATRRGYTLETTGDGHFVVYRFSPKRPTLLGRRSQLKVDVDEPDPAHLRSATLKDGRGRVELDKLTAADLTALRSALGVAGD